MQYSDNYNLRLPQRGVDRANVDDLDYNLEVIDGALADDRQISLLMYDSTSTYNTGDIVGYENPTTHRIRAFRCLEDNVTGPWDGTKWAQTTLAAEIEAGGGGGGSSTLAGLSDVDFGTLADGEVLTYNATEGKWVNAECGGASELSDLDDVSLTTPTEGQILTYDGDEWVNADAPDVDVTKTASGNPIEISDGANAPLVKCVTQITGYQQGSGTPSPDNIRPITAYTEGEIEVRGKNILNPSAPIETFDLTGAGVYRYGASFEGNKTYTLINTTSSDEFYYRTPKADLSDRGASVQLLANSYATVTVPSDCILWLFTGIMSTWQTYVSDYAVIIGTDTTYEPYTSITHTTTFTNSIYQGNADFVGGSATGEYELVTFDGSENWDGTSNIHGVSLPEKYRCNQIPIANEFNGVSPKSSAYFYDGEIALTPSYTAINVAMPYQQTANEFKQWLSEHPLQVVLKLATPTTETITPSNAPVKSLKGYSHIESSTGDMEIEYITGKYQPIVDLIESSSGGGGGVTQTILYTATAMTDTEINVDLTAYDEYIIYANDTLPSAQIPHGNSFPKSVFQYVLSMSNPNIMLYGYSSAYCSYTVSSNKLTFSESGLNFRIVMIVGLKFGVTPTETRSLSLSKGGEPEVVDKVDKVDEEKKVDEKVDEPKEEFAKEPVEQPSEPISEPLETKTDSLSKDDTELKEEDESKEIEEVTEEPTEEPEVTEEEPTEEPVDPEPSKEEEADER